MFRPRGDASIHSYVVCLDEGDPGNKRNNRAGWLQRQNNKRQNRKYKIANKQKDKDYET